MTEQVALENKWAVELSPFLKQADIFSIAESARQAGLTLLPMSPICPERGQYWEMIGFDPTVTYAQVRTFAEKNIPSHLWRMARV